MYVGGVGGGVAIVVGVEVASSVIRGVVVVV